MSLLHVCRAWRSIAAATPRLWVDLRLDLKHVSEPFLDADNFNQLIADWLVRVGACPISLDLQAFPKRAGDGRRLITTIFDRLSSHMRELELATDINYFPRHTPGFPLLRKLTLALGHVKDKDVVRFHRNFIQVFSAAPHLRELSLLHAPPSLFTIPWEGLIEFTGDGISTKEIHPWISILRAISHPNLKSFDFVICNGAPFFQFLTFPALEHLYVWPDDPDDEHLLQFISQASSSLLTLFMREVPLDLLSSMVSLNKLELDVSDEYALEFLGLFNRNPRFLPRLEVLEIEQSEPSVNTILIDALSSRCAMAGDGGTRLRTFRQIRRGRADTPEVEYSSKEEKEDVWVEFALEKLKQNGMVTYRA
ncbi:hypothetical protein B0H12DRAFT_1100608 [Mycena haematopus]|nr:hypothetical protein B0H12DRAFT_1100608 [Mycena haematopus]